MTDESLQKVSRRGVLTSLAIGLWGSSLLENESWDFIESPPKEPNVRNAEIGLLSLEQKRSEKIQGEKFLASNKSVDLPEEIREEVSKIENAMEDYDNWANLSRLDREFFRFDERKLFDKSDIYQTEGAREAISEGRDLGEVVDMLLEDGRNPVNPELSLYKLVEGRELSVDLVDVRNKSKLDNTEENWLSPYRNKMEQVLDRFMPEIDFDISIRAVNAKHLLDEEKSSNEYDLNEKLNRYFRNSWWNLPIFFLPKMENLEHGGGFQPWNNSAWVKVPKEARDLTLDEYDQVDRMLHEFFHSLNHPHNAYPNNSVYNDNWDNPRAELIREMILGGEADLEYRNDKGLWMTFEPADISNKSEEEFEKQFETLIENETDVSLYNYNIEYEERTIKGKKQHYSVLEIIKDLSRSQKSKVDVAVISPEGHDYETRIVVDSNGNIIDNDEFEYLN